MDEYTYGDLDADGVPVDENDDTSWRDPDTLDPSVAKVARKFMAICSYPGNPRKYFRTKAERKQWDRIERHIGLSLPLDWITHCYRLVEYLNKDKIKKVFADATDMILDKQTKADWVAKHYIEPGVATDGGHDPGLPVDYD